MRSPLSDNYSRIYSIGTTPDTKSDLGSSDLRSGDFISVYQGNNGKFLGRKVRRMEILVQRKAVRSRQLYFRHPPSIGSIKNLAPRG